MGENLFLIDQEFASVPLNFFIMSTILKKEVLAYSALIFSMVPAAFACFGILMIGLNSVSSMYSADALIKMVLLTVVSGGLTFLLIRNAYKHFAKASYRRG